MKRLLYCLICVLYCAGAATAVLYDFTDTLGQTAAIDVEYWTGTGDSETLLVIDWNQSGNYVTASHAFGYRWDGSTTTLSQMLDAIVNNGGLGVHITTFLQNLYYQDAEGDAHAHNEAGSWNYASTGDLYAQWGSYDSTWTMLGEWEANQGDMDSEYIADGQLEGINVFYWFDTTQPYENLDVPFVPEPASLLLLGFGGLLIRRK